MALTHDMSQECVKSELDLFTVPMTQTAIEKYTYVEVQPLSAITQDSPIEFVIAGGSDQYVDLNNTLLYTKLKITLANGNDIPAEAPSV